MRLSWRRRWVSSDRITLSACDSVGACRNWCPWRGAQSALELPGASYFDFAQTFGMIRGGQVEVAILGAMQISAHGDTAADIMVDFALLERVG